jgi:hypothetical protein
MFLHFGHCVISNSVPLESSSWPFDSISDPHFGHFCIRYLATFESVLEIKEMNGEYKTDCELFIISLFF